MNLQSIKKNIQKNGIRGALKKYTKKAAQMTLGIEDHEKKYTILLLTNKDSDNVGDQVIEACDRSLLYMIMKNLGVTNYRINSKPATLVKEPFEVAAGEHLLPARNEIRDCDVVVFGGTPVFNYLYQPTYARTARTIELAEEYGKPMIFSAVGVDRYDEENEKCRRLEEVINRPNVLMITTRDNFDSLEKFKYKENTQLEIGTVSDPAVFSRAVFRPYLAKEKGTKKKIGVFILRSAGFTDNQIDLPREKASELWMQVIQELERRGYEYELLTSGHCSDEAFLDHLICDCGVAPEKAIFNVNAPEKLVGKISEYDAVISCRLHPSIISFALGVPSVGINWNNKVKGFYHNIGYDNRVLYPKTITAEQIVNKMEEALVEGVEQKEEYLMSVYTTLFAALKRVLCPDNPAKPYTYQQLESQLLPYEGTSPEEYQAKLRRKFRRIYGNYNRLVEKEAENKKRIKEFEERSSL